MSCKGVVFAVDLGLISLKEKTAIRHRIESRGGTINAIVGSSVRVVIITAAVRTSGSYKITSAEKLGIPVFLVEDLDEVLAFPPPPRSATAAGSSSSLSSSVSSLGPAVAASSLIAWDEPSSVSSYADLSPSVVAPTTSLLAASSSSFTDFFGGFGDEEDLLAAAPSSRAYSSSAAPAPSTVASYVPSSSCVDEEDEGGFGFLSGLADDFAPASRELASLRFIHDASAYVAPTSSSVKASLLAESADSGMGFNNLFDEFAAPSAPSRASSSYAPKAATAASSISFASFKAEAPKKAKKSAPHTQPKQRPIYVPKVAAPAVSSGSRIAREAKYREITSKTVEPLLATPLKIAQPSFTPLGFDLKPSSIAPSPAKPLSTKHRFGPAASKDFEPIVFETTFGGFDFGSSASGSASSQASSLRSSLTSLSELKASASEPESENSSFEGSPRHSAPFSSVVDADNGMESDEEYDDWDGDDGEEALEGKKNGAQDAARPVKRLRMARIFVDRQTGVMWQRKDAKFKAPTKLVLEYGKGVSRSFDSTTGLINRGPDAAPKSSAPAKPKKQPVVAKPSGPLVPSSSVAVVDETSPAVSENLADSEHWHTETSLLPFDATSIRAFGPALPASTSKVNRRYATGPTNDKFSWVDIVTGKASTTKRVPALDGQKLFLSGFKFDDILLHGKSREEQFSFYKEQELDKVKEKNAKAIRLLKKKQRKKALEKATVDADGTVNVDKSISSATPKLSDDKTLMRMKTDEQIMNDIVVWPVKRVEATIAQRKQHIQSIFMRFGEMIQWNPNWDKGFIHIAYKRADSARTAIRALSDFDNRASVVRRLREGASPLSKESVPSPSFYVRWTACYQRKLDRKADAAKQQKLASQDAAVAKHAAAAASATASISATVKAKSKAKTAA